MNIEVQVLLATYNGGQYLESFLQSLADQENVEVHLTVSDDGSNDNTLEILQKYQGRFAQFTLLVGPGNGPCQNFMRLISVADGDYIAFADQDDVWHTAKLWEAYKSIRNLMGPSLYIGSVSKLGKPQNSSPYRVPLSTIRNRSQGCAMFFNRELLEKFKKISPDHIIMHDWAAVLLAQFYGNIVHDQRTFVEYRIHDSNFIGHPTFSSKIKRFVVNLFRRDNYKLLTRQLQEALRIYDHRDDNNNLRLAKEWEKTLSGSLTSRIGFINNNKSIMLTSTSGLWASLLVIVNAYDINAS
jgi:glycosyltransferase involved in cell wall biosynthesis